MCFFGQNFAKNVKKSEKISVKQNDAPVMPIPKGGHKVQNLIGLLSDQSFKLFFGC